MLNLHPLVKQPEFISVAKSNDVENFETGICVGVQVTHALPNTTHELFSKLFIHLLAESPWGGSELTSPTEKSRPQLLNGLDFIVVDQFLKVLVDTLHLHIQMDAGKSLVAFV